MKRQASQGQKLLQIRPPVVTKYGSEMFTPHRFNIHYKHFDQMKLYIFIGFQKKILFVSRQVRSRFVMMVCIVLEMSEVIAMGR